MTNVLEPPCSYGKYELKERIGVGGMAEIYRATMPGHAGFAKTVAIKRLRPPYNHDDAYATLFIDEAKLAAQVHHKNVVQVFELGSIGTNELFMAMEWVDGIDLRRLQRIAAQQKTPLPPWLCVHIAMEVLEALAFAHDLVDHAGRRRNVVHCDVTPDNVFISRSGEVKLADFGVATDDTRAHDPLDGQVKGKAPYLAPEMLDGGRPDHRADVFACATVLWESLTLHRLFFAESPRESMSRVCLGRRPAPSELASGIPAALDRAVIRALEPKIEDRTASARALLDELAEIYEDIRPRMTLIDIGDVVRGIVGKEIDLSRSSEGVDLPVFEDDDDLELVDDDDVVSILADADSAGGGSDEDAAADAFDMSDDIATFAAAPEDDEEPELPRTASHYPQPSEDLGYSFIRPSARRVVTGPAAPIEIPIPGKPCDHETGDVVFDHLPDAARAPIAAEPGSRETSEVLATAGDVPIGTLLFRVSPSRVYGPSDPIDAIGTLGALLASGEERQSAEVSADGVRWMSWRRYAELLDEAIVGSSDELPQNQFSGSLEQHSIVSLFGQLARTQSTGRLILVRHVTGRVQRYEIHLRDGQLTAVTSNGRPFEGFDELLEQPDLRPTMLKADLQTVALRAVPFEEIASTASQMALATSRARATYRLLTDVFSWSAGYFGFEADTEVDGVVLRPLLRLLPGMLSKTHRPDVLRAKLVDLLDIPLERRDRFDQEARMLGLGSGPSSPVGAFGMGYTLMESLAQSAVRSDDRVALAIAYLLLELGLLRPVQDASARR